MKEIRMGILISGKVTNMRAIVNACEFEKIDGKVVFVGADNPDAKGLIWAKEKRIPTFVVNYGKISRAWSRRVKEDWWQAQFSRDVNLGKLLQHAKSILPDKIELAEQAYIWFVKRTSAEKLLLAKIKKYNIDLLVLAGFMRNLSAYFIDKFSPDPMNPRIMNIHPALLPAFPGTDGYGDTFRYGCKVGGCTVHFVDYGEDTGPIIGQRTFPIVPRDTVKSVKDRGLHEEYKLFPQCIQLFAQDRLRVMDTTYHFGHPGGPDDREYSRKVVKILDERG